MLLAVLVRQTGVVGAGLVTHLIQLGTDGLDLLATDTVDDPRLILVPFHNGADLTRQLVAPLDAVSQVGAVEAADEDLRLTERQLLDDVVADSLIRGRGEGVDADLGELLAKEFQSAIVGPKVVAPVADAVGLVDRKKTDARVPQTLDQPFRVETLGGQIDQLEPLGIQVSCDVPLLLGSEGAVDESGGHTVGPQGVDLVLHQRDQRRDDNSHAVHADCRSLITERLPAAGRQHDQRVLTLQHAEHRRLLQGAELVIAPMHLQGGQ